MLRRPGMARSFAGLYKTAEMQATGNLSDGPSVLLDYALRILRVTILLGLWRTVMEGRGAVNGMTLAAALTYTLLAEVFVRQLDVTTRIEDAMWEGTLAGRYLRPSGIVAQFSAQLAGDWAFGLVTFSVPLLLLAPVLGVDPRPASVAAGVLFAASLSLAVVIGLAVDFIFAGAAAAFETGVWQVKYVRTALSTVLSGSIVPLALLPWGLGEVFQWLPFASMVSAPLRIYTGTGEPLWLMALQLAWAAALWPCAIWTWSAHREKLAAYGG